MPFPVQNLLPHLTVQLQTAHEKSPSTFARLFKGAKSTLAGLVPWAGLPPGVVLVHSLNSQSEVFFQRPASDVFAGADAIRVSLINAESVSKFASSTNAEREKRQTVSSPLVRIVLEAPAQNIIASYPGKGMLARLKSPKDILKKSPTNAKDVFIVGKAGVNTYQGLQSTQQPKVVKILVEDQNTQGNNMFGKAADRDTIETALKLMRLNPNVPVEISRSRSKSRLTHAPFDFAAELSRQDAVVRDKINAMEKAAAEKRNAKDAVYQTFSTLYATNAGAHAINTMMRNAGTHTGQSAPLSLKISAVMDEIDRQFGPDTLMSYKRNGVDITSDMKYFAAHTEFNAFAREMYAGADPSKLTEHRIHRGQGMTIEGIRKLELLCAASTPVTPTHFWSFDRKPEVATEFAHRCGKEEKRVEFHTRAFSHLHLLPYENVVGESEYVFTPNANFKITGISINANTQTHHVNMTEIEADPLAVPMPY
jgi:hypothetical protein